MKKTLLGPDGLSVVLDSNEIYPDNPGAGTPALVVKRKGDRTASFDCAADTGELDGGAYLLNAAEAKWLESVRPEVESFIETNTPL